MASSSAAVEASWTGLVALMRSLSRRRPHPRVSNSTLSSLHLRRIIIIAAISGYWCVCGCDGDDKWKKGDGDGGGIGVYGAEATAPRTTPMMPAGEELGRCRCHL